MKLFKKALLATAVFGAMGAQAATISSTAFELSKEGVAFKVAPTAKTISFDVVVDKEHPSASIITLNFDAKVDLNGLTGGPVAQSVDGGTAYAGDVGFNYGTGSFTFDNVEVNIGDRTKGETDSISFKVNLGNPLTANSAFRVTLGNHATLDGADDGAGSAIDCATSVAGAAVAGCGVAKVLISGESKLSYISHTASDALIETGTGELAKEVPQYSFEVTEKLDGVINRVDGTSFIYTGSTTLTTDELKYKVTNNETLGLALLGSDLRAVFAGDFEGASNFDEKTASSDSATAGYKGQLTFTNNGTTTVETGVAVDYAVVNAATAVTGVDNEVSEVVTFTNDGSLANSGTPTADDQIAIPVTGDVKAQLVLTAATNVGVGVTFPSTTGYTLFNDVDAGKWEIDATIINVPYVPINATNTSTFIHFANETQKDVDVIVTAIDNNGVEYGPMDLGYDLPAHTVTKFSQSDMNKFFDLDGKSTKLSITFNVDADKNEVSAYAVSQNDKGRTEVSTSQQRGN